MRGGVERGNLAGYSGARREQVARTLSPGAWQSDPAGYADVQDNPSLFNFLNNAVAP